MFHHMELVRYWLTHRRKCISFFLSCWEKIFTSGLWKFNYFFLLCWNLDSTCLVYSSLLSLIIKLLFICSLPPDLFFRWYQLKFSAGHWSSADMPIPFTTNPVGKLGHRCTESLAVTWESSHCFTPRRICTANRNAECWNSQQLYGQTDQTLDLD